MRFDHRFDDQFGDGGSRAKNDERGADIEGSRDEDVRDKVVLSVSGHDDFFEYCVLHVRRGVFCRLDHDRDEFFGFSRFLVVVSHRVSIRVHDHESRIERQVEKYIL